MFPCEFCEISKNTFFIEHLWRLLLELDEFFLFISYVYIYIYIALLHSSV